MLEKLFIVSVVTTLIFISLSMLGIVSDKQQAALTLFSIAVAAAVVVFLLAIIRILLT